MPHNLYSLAVVYSSDFFKKDAQNLAKIANLPLKNMQDLSEPCEFDALVLFDENGVSLKPQSKQASGAIYVDFASGAVNYRRLHGGGKGQMIAKAMGLRSLKVKNPTVIDATAGMGKDGFLLASLGCEVQMFERSPVVFALLNDGLRRARATEELSEIMQHIDLKFGNAIDLLAKSAVTDVVYLDPMFPDRKKSAKVKKEMSAFKYLVGKDEDAHDLLEVARTKARYRVVVKRPRIAGFVAGEKPSFSIEGKSSRFDVYVCSH